MKQLARGALLALGMVAVPTTVFAELSAGHEAYDYYRYYRGGYDDDREDDWFFDDYELEEHVEDRWTYYDNYHWERDVFDWEEAGLFEDPVAPPKSKRVKQTARGQAPCPRESPESAMRRRSKTRQVQGIVIDIKEVSLHGTGTRNMVALVATRKGDRRLVVDLGPREQTARLRLKQGTPMAAQGIVVRVDDEQLLVAGKVRSGNLVVSMDRAEQERHFARSRADAE